MLLRDVAAAAGVSVATASRALRGDIRVASATRTRVTEAAATLGYQPDPMLASLAGYRKRLSSRQRLETIAHITSWPGRTGAETEQSLPGFADRCAHLGYQIEWFTVSADRAEQRALGERLQARGIRGLLLGTGVVQQDELDFSWQHFSCISISGAPQMRYFSSVTVNYAHNVSLVLAELAQRGYKRPGLLVDEATLRATRSESRTGWGHAYAFDHTRPPAPPLTVTGVEDLVAVQQWIAAEQIDAVVAFAPHWLAALRQCGLRIPHQVGFVVLDAIFDPLVAGIMQPRTTCAEVALDLLAMRLYRHDVGPEATPRVIQIAGTWRDGATV